MDWTRWLSISSNIAQIITGVAAAIVGGNYVYRRYRRRRALEAHLKDERNRHETSDNLQSGSRSVMHLMAHLAMTEEQILEAAFASRKVKRWTGQDPETGRANALFLQYDEGGGAHRDSSN